MRASTSRASIRFRRSRPRTHCRSCSSTASRGRRSSSSRRRCASWPTATPRSASSRTNTTARASTSRATPPVSAKTVDAALAEFGSKQVYLVGHSRGTTVSTAYLADPANAAKVAKYVAIDGAPCVDVVPCLAPTQETNPGQSHVEVATSKESFAAMYEFLLGEAPKVVDIVPQRAPVVLTGRAVNFPANTGRRGARLAVWNIDPDTGMRVGDKPARVVRARRRRRLRPVRRGVGRALRVGALGARHRRPAPSVPPALRPRQPPGAVVVVGPRRRHPRQHERRRRPRRHHRDPHARVVRRRRPGWRR